MAEELVEARDVGAAQQLKPLRVGFGHLIKPRFLFRRDRRCCRHCHAQRVLMYVVNAEFVMQMRAGGKTGSADVADYFALCDALTSMQTFGKRRQVAIPGGEL